MAQEGSEASVASSSPTPMWWEIQTNPVLSWNSMNRWQPHSNSASCEDQDMPNVSTTSFTNASNAHLGLGMDASSADLSGEQSENQLWSQVLFDVGNGGGDLHDSHGNGESFLELLSSKSLATEMFNPACDYLKKLDSSWKFTDPSPVNSIEKHLNSYNNRTVVEPERLNNVSGLVGNWSIAPPNTTCNVPLNPARLPNSPSFLGNGSTGYNPTNSYVHGIKGESQHQDHMGGPHRNGAMGSHQVCLNNSMIGLGNRYCNGISSDAPWSNNARNLSDLISFGSCSNKPAMQFRATARPSSKGSESTWDDSKKQGCEISPSLQTNRSGRGGGTTSEGKKKRSEESTETLFKKSKHESSDASSVKVQPPKVKLGERITALQQIVSPFGKTDTASVLLEAINYIRFLQEQVQLLSDPYLKSSWNKDHNSWRGVERKDEADTKLDLRSRGLCLVPISCTPQVYRENTGPDYWTPTYRGCLYR